MSLHFDIGKYGFEGKSQEIFTVIQVPAYAKQKGGETWIIGDFVGSDIQFDIKVEARDIVLLEIRQKSSTDTALLEILENDIDDDIELLEIEVTEAVKEKE